MRNGQRSTFSKLQIGSLAITVLAAMGLSWPAEESSAATLRVEQDGSGDFTAIQPAIDASAPGDTVLIGLGRYQEFEPKQLQSGYTGLFVAFVEAGPLVLIGESREGVILGPEEKTATIDEMLTFGVAVQFNPPGITIENLTLENCHSLVIVGGPEGTTQGMTIEECTLRTPARFAVELLGTDGFRLRDCHLHAIAGALNEDAIAPVSVRQNRNMIVERCVFEYWLTPLNLGNVQNVDIIDCEFRTNGGGIQFWAGSTGTVRSCTFKGGINGDIDIVQSSTIELRGNRFGGGGFLTAVVSGSAFAYGENNVFGGGSVATIRVNGSANAEFHNCDIENGGGWSVQVLQPVENVPTLNLTNNYWTTLDPSQVDEWIFDSNDDPVQSLVLYEPILDHSVPATKASIGGLKGSFRPRR